MNTRRFKIAFLFGLYAALHVWQACDIFPNCECPDVLEHFDYKQVTIETDKATYPIGSNLAELTVRPDSTWFTADANREAPWFPGPMNALWACSCPDEGGLGDKWLITDFDIYANVGFNDSLPPGRSLNPIMKMDFGGQAQFLPVGYGTTAFQHPEKAFKMTVWGKPDDRELPCIFKVVLVRTSGDSIVAESLPVKFE